jgi:hypothetical protein
MVLFMFPVTLVLCNLKEYAFGDTYFIGDAGTEISVRQTAIHNGFIYAAKQRRS